MVRLLADIKSNIKLGGFRSQLQTSYMSSHTEMLWYNDTVFLWMTIHTYIYMGFFVLDLRLTNPNYVAETINVRDFDSSSISLLDTYSQTFAHTHARTHAHSGIHMHLTHLHIYKCITLSLFLILSLSLSLFLYIYIYIHMKREREREIERERERERDRKRENAQILVCRAGINCSHTFSWQLHN